MSKVSLRYAVRPPGGGRDVLLEVSTALVTAIPTLRVAANHIASQYHHAHAVEVGEGQFDIQDAQGTLLATLRAAD